MLRPLLTGILAAALLGGCTSEPPPAPTPLTAVAADKGFVLSMAVPSDRFAVGQAIDVRTTLTWTGPEPTVTVWGSGSGPVGFLFEELTGRQRRIGGAMTSDCGQHRY